MIPFTSNTSTSGSNATVTYTTFSTRLRTMHRSYGWWGVLDQLGHKLKLPGWLMQPVCDHYEIAVGVPKADLIEMDYKGRAPWWLR